MVGHASSGTEAHETYQRHTLDDECPEAQETLHDEPRDNALDFGYP